MQAVDVGSAVNNRDEVVHDERNAVVSQHWTTEVFDHHFRRADVNGTQQRTVSAHMLRTNHQAVCAQIFHRIHQLIEHGEGHGRVRNDALIGRHQLSNAVEGFRVFSGVTLDQVAAECARQTFHFGTNLDSQLAIGVGHGGCQEFINVNVASQNTQLSHMLGERCSAFWNHIVHVNEAGFRQ